MVPEVGRVVAGKYRLERPLAAGGMGSVWVARHLDLDRDVALKVMGASLRGSPLSEARFKREARAAAQLQSPHVVHIHDYGLDDGTPYMVMELLAGEDLAAEIARTGRLGVRRVSEVLTQVAKALGIAHEKGIVHRDIKPSNLFVSESGDERLMKVLDFGVAKEQNPTLVVEKTTSGQLVGSPRYMSPEQARGEAIDARSDLWSLGVVVYEALVGAPPFDSPHLGALLTQINEATPTPPSSRIAGLPIAVDGFISRALARDPEKRFPTARAMAEAFAAIAIDASDRAAASSAAIEGADPAHAASRGAASIEVRTTDRDPTPAEVPSGRLSETLLADPLPVSTTTDRAAPVPIHPRKRGARAAILAGIGVLVALGIAWFMTDRSDAPPASGAAIGDIAAQDLSRSAASNGPSPPADLTVSTSVAPASSPSGAPIAPATAAPKSSTKPLDPSEVATSRPSASAPIATASQAPSSAVPVASSAVVAPPQATSTATSSATSKAAEFFGLTPTKP